MRQPGATARPETGPSQASKDDQGPFARTGRLVAQHDSARLSLATRSDVRVRRLRAAWLGTFVFLFAGSLVLGYGFANIGVRAGPLPLPLADVLLGALLVLGVLLKWRLPSISAIRWIVGLSALVVLRLVLDFPIYGVTAIRDASLGLEVWFFLIGWWGVRHFGLDAWIRALRWPFLLLVPAVFLYPWQNALAAIGPTIGLQQPVALLGTLGSGPASVSAGLFFVLFRPFGRWSSFFAAVMFGSVFLYQARGVYIALPLAVLVAWLVAPRRSGLATSVKTTTVLVLVLLGIMVIVAPQGRFGGASFDLVFEQLGTLAGNEGVGAGSLRHRLEMIELTTDAMAATPWSWLIGVGLGPDLVGSFSSGGVVPVRKPHNDYLEVYARLGTVGVVCFLGVVLATMTRTLQAAQRLVGLRGVLLAWSLGTAVTYLVIAGTQPLLAYVHGTAPLFVALGSGYAASLRSPQRRPERAKE